MAVLGVVGLAGLCAVAGFLLFDALVVEPNWITVRRVRIENPDLAAALEGVRVAQISDLHLRGSLGFRERSLIARLNRLRPDLILITGDLVEGPGQGRLAVEFIRQLKPGLWSYGVLGNADRNAFSVSQRNALRRAGLEMIGERALRMQPGAAPAEFYLAGIDFPGYGQPVPADRIREIVSGVPPGKPIIFLAYSPDAAEALADEGVDLVLSGDSHGGQVGLPGWGSLFEEFGRSRFVRGLYRLKNTVLYVNRGIATKTVPIRFLCPPEITLFEFTR